MAGRKDLTSDSTPGVVSLGAKLRNLRHERGLTMKEVAALADLTESFISQVERDSVNPSVASLLRICEALGVHIANLFDAPAKPTGRVVRSSERSRMVYPGFASMDALLTPDLNGKLEVIWAESDAGGSSGEQYYAHLGDEECIVVIKGSLEIWVGEERHVLHAGDAITFESRTPHRWKNAGRGKMQAIWVITPPSY